MTALRSRPLRITIAAIAGALAALAVSCGNLWLKCQQPASDACLWTKSYLPLSLAFTFVFLGVPVFVVALILMRRYVSREL